MKKHPRQRGYFGDTVRKGASGPARPGKKNARRTDDEQTFVSVPGGLDAEEVLGLMGKIRHPVRLDDLIRFLDLSRRDKKPLENLLDALQAEGRVIRLRGGKWVEASQAPDRDRRAVHSALRGGVRDSGRGAGLARGRPEAR